MTLRTSTGLRNQLLDSDSLFNIMNLGFIKIYSGPIPATADAALDPGNTLLSTISNNSTATGLTMDTTASGGVLAKKSAEVWSGANVANGTAAFYRHVAVGDDGTLSTTQARIQGKIATFGAELNLTSVALSSGATQTIDFYTVALPTL